MAFAQKFIQVRGENIVGPDGKPFLMKGINLGNWLVPEGYMFKFKNANSPRLIHQALLELVGPDYMRFFWNQFLDRYISRVDIHYLKSVGVNSIRVPFNYRLFTKESYLGTNDANRGFRLLDRLITWCRAEGIYVLLDMHCAPGGQTGDNIDDSNGYPFLFESPESQDLTVAIWKKIAAHYAKEPMVIGYDLLNEPIPHFFDKDKLNPLLEPLYKKITKAIREVDKNHLIFLGGAQWDSNFKPFGPPFDSKLVYTFHKYWTAPTKDVIQDYLDFRDKYKVPIYCGETGENDDSWIEQFRKTLDENHVGWHYWPYKKMNDPRGMLSFETPAYYEQIIQYADTTRANFEDIRKFRPANTTQLKAALEGYLDNCLFTRCKPNPGYLKALGFKGE